MTVMIRLAHSRHIKPVHPTNEFAPTQNLPDESLYRLKRRCAIVVGLLSSRDHLTRVKQMQIERR